MANKFEVGVKIYDSDWFLKYNLSYKDAARSLRKWGVSFVLAQNRFLTMPDSAVKSEVTSNELARYASYDDLKFREALADEGIGYWATVCMFFAPQEIEQNPSLAAIGSDGLLMEKFDWYIGISPTNEKFVRKQISAIEQALRKLEPDGLFMSFTRWPGFWELWTPGRKKEDFREYSFDQQTLERFEKDTGITLPRHSPAQWIEKNVADSWINWKCQIVTDVIAQVKKACQKIKPDIQIMLNTLPFRLQDFDNARKNIFGQDVRSLRDVVDVFEVMTYHQILKQSTNWIADAGMQVKNASGRKTVCTIQATPLYLEDIYSQGNRSTNLSLQEFTRAINTAKNSGLDGVVVFTWSDLLRKVIIEKDQAWADVLLDATM